MCLHSNFLPSQSKACTLFSRKWQYQERAFLTIFLTTFRVQETSSQSQQLTNKKVISISKQVDLNATPLQGDTKEDANQNGHHIQKCLSFLTAVCIFCSPGLNRSSTTGFNSS